MKNFCDKLRCLRVQKGLSQENMAFDLNISVTAYSKIERGLTNITLERLRQIAVCLNISMVLLVEYYENESIEVKKGFPISSTYVEVPESEELTMIFLDEKISELKENYRTLSKTVDVLKNVIQEIFHKA